MLVARFAGFALPATHLQTARWLSWQSRGLKKRIGYFGPSRLDSPAVSKPLLASDKIEYGLHLE
jgi:hypothetical protein